MFVDADVAETFAIVVVVNNVVPAVAVAIGVAKQLNASFNKNISKDIFFSLVTYLIKHFYIM